MASDRSPNRSEGNSLSPELVAQRGFTVAFRGFDQIEVREFLGQLADELRALRSRVDGLSAQLRSAEDRAAHPKLDPDVLFEAVGEETATILRTARNAAEELRRRAEEESSRAVDLARQQAGEMLAEAESALARATAEAEAAADKILTAAREAAEAERSAARSDAEAIVERARQEAEAVRQSADHDRRLTIEGAQSVREKILADLSKRRRVASVQIEQLRAGRERLLESYGVVRRTLEEVNEELQRADSEARLAAEEAGRRFEPDLSVPTVADSLAVEHDIDQLSAPPGEATPLESPNPATGVGAAGAEATSEPDSGGVRGGGLGGHSGGLSLVAGEQGSPAPSAGGRGPGKGQDEGEQNGTEQNGTEQNGTEQDGTGQDGAEDASGGSGGEALPPGSEAGAPGAFPGPGRKPAGLVSAPGGAAHEAAEDPGGVQLPEGSARGPRSAARAEAVDAGALSLQARARESQGPSPGGSDLGESGQAPGEPTGVDGLFARIRAGRADAVAQARRVLGPTPTSPSPGEPEHSPAHLLEERAAQKDSASEDPSARSDSDDDLEPAMSEEDEALLDLRDGVLADLELSLSRKLKRSLQDEQNDLLDRLRSLKGEPRASALMSTPRAQSARYASAARSLLERAADAGADFAAAVLTSAGVRPASPSGRPDLTELTADLAKDIAVPLRRGVEKALTNSAGEEQVAIVEAVGAVYREWKTQRVERAAGDCLAAAFALGTRHSLPEGVGLRWIVEDIDGPCADCDDNALAGVQAVSETFPTGQAHPPAHPGCRCLLVPEKS